ncbi:hypothetical protein EMCRGX_G015754 [Ephydatia muelleri]
MSYNCKDVCRFVDLIRTCHSEARTFALTEFPDIIGSVLLRKQYLETKVVAQEFCRLCNELAHYVCKSGALEDARENLERQSAREFTNFLTATVASLSECTLKSKVLARDLERLKDVSSLVEFPLLGEVQPVTAALVGEPQEREVFLVSSVGTGLVCFGLSYYAWQSGDSDMGNAKIKAIFASRERLSSKMKEIESNEKCLRVSGEEEQIRLPDDMFKIKGFLSGLKDSLEPCLLSL